MSEEDEQVLPDIWETLPFDVQQHVLDMLSPSDCDRLSLVCTYFKHLARNSESWKRSYLYQLDSNLQPPRLFAPGDYREACLLRLRIRYDGVYFAKCSYVRIIGAGQSLTDSRTYMSVVYFRFFRFFKDGTAAMLTHPADTSSGSAKAPLSVYKRLTEATTASALIEETSRLEKASIICSFVIKEDQITFRYNEGRNQWIGRLTVDHWKYRRSAILRWERYSYWNIDDFHRHVDDRRLQTPLPVIVPADPDLIEEDIPKELFCSINIHLEQHFPIMKFKADRKLAYLF